MSKTQIIITGDVQGVGFRYSAQEKANELGLILHETENRPDGSVVLVVGGQDETTLPLVSTLGTAPASTKHQKRGAGLQKFIAWAKIGPVGARVKNINVQKI
ncbi:MAG: acylphosphatase [bacterium]|nr:acylphosphatase [bacterium]